MSSHAVAFPHEHRMNSRLASGTRLAAVRDTTSHLLQGPTARFAAMSRVLYAIANYSDLGELLTHLAMELAGFLAFDAIALTEYDEATKKVSRHCVRMRTNGTNTVEKGTSAWTYEHLDESSGENAGKAFRTAEPCTVTSAFSAATPHESITSVTAHSLTRQNRVLGALELGRREYQPFSRDEETFLTQVAKPVAMAVETARAGEHIAKLRDALARQELNFDIAECRHAEERTRNENLALRERIDRDSMFEDIVGSSNALRKVLRQVVKVAPSDSTVMIMGETGTGKELIARAIHKRSTRSERAFIGVNCAAIPPSLIASELFGHEKGAFTGATERRIGRFEAANGGTIFLDEVGDLPPEIQIALLRVLQEREIERVGSNKTIPVDVRVLAATHRDLNALVAEGKFRQDLLYRLNVVPIQMPSLRDRGEDIPVLVEYFVDRFGKKTGKRLRTMDKRTAELLEAYTWPGNVRELQNVIERAVILSEGDIVRVDETWLKHLAQPSSSPTLTFNGALEKQERGMIETALTESAGRVSGPDGAATKLGLPRATLDAKIKRLGINKYQFRVQRSA